MEIVSLRLHCSLAEWLHCIVLLLPYLAKLFIASGLSNTIVAFVGHQRFWSFGDWVDGWGVRQNQNWFIKLSVFIMITIIRERIYMVDDSHRLYELITFKSSMLNFMLFIRSMLALWSILLNRLLFQYLYQRKTATNWS